jgi:hypothetical protein
VGLIHNWVAKVAVAGLLVGVELHRPQDIRVVVEEWRLSLVVTRTLLGSSRHHFRVTATSVTFGNGLITAAAGSAEGALIVSDIEEAHGNLVHRRIEVSDIWHGPPFPVEARQPGLDPENARI